MSLIMLIVGVICLITGKLRLSKHVTLTGARARIFGAILIAPFPFGFVMALGLGLFAGVFAPEMTETRFEEIAMLAGAALTFGCLIAAFLFAYISLPKPLSANADRGIEPNACEHNCANDATSSMSSPTSPSASPSG